MATRHQVPKTAANLEEEEEKWRKTYGVAAETKQENVLAKKTDA